MNKLDYYFWLAGQAWSTLPYYWPVTTGLACSLLLSLAWTFLVKKRSFEPKLLWTLSPCLIPLLILVVGVIFAGDPFSLRQEILLPQGLIYLLLFAHLPAAITLGFKLRNYLWLVLAISAWITWFSFWAAFVSVCSVTTDWP